MSDSISEPLLPPSSHCGHNKLDEKKTKTLDCVSVLCKKERKTGLSILFLVLL